MAHILLVEDNELNRDMLSRRLRRRGHEVSIAVDGTDAIAVVATTPPDLILMDMSLPIMDGWEATKILKSDPSTASIPIIALTAHAMEGEREKALGVGCDDYDTKPVEIRRLLKKMDVFLGESVSQSVSQSVRTKLSSPVAPAQPASPAAPAQPASQVPLASQSPFASPSPFPSPSQPTPTPVPSAPVPSAPVPSALADSAPSLSTPVQSGSSVGTFLVVDDNADNRDVLKRRLVRKGHAVVAVASGEEALDYLSLHHSGESLINDANHKPIDLVLLDVMMPGMDGIETLQRIRQAYSQVQLPVIMVTAKDSNQDMLLAFELGANDYVTKPIDFEVAIARIQTHLLTVQAVRRQAAPATPPVTPAPITPSPVTPSPVTPSPVPPASITPSSATPSSPPASPQPSLPVPPALFTSPPAPISFRPSAPPHPTPSPFNPPSFRPPAPVTGMQRGLNGRYDVLQVLGKDIFSQILIAKDTEHPNQPLYFIKKINVDRLPLGLHNRATRQQLSDFLEEEVKRIQAISQHQYITTLVECFEQDDAFFMVQNFVDGVVLADHFQANPPLPLTQVVPLLKDLFGTLEFVHQQRIVHGEIHAQHLIRRHIDDKIILIDYGLTQRILHHFNPNVVTEIGYIQGYMPPEQCEGQLLFSSDVYALGMLLLQAITGKTPEYINRDVVTGELKWRDLADVDDKTAGVIQKMICQSYAERYAYPEQASKDLLFQWYTLRFKRNLS